MIYYALYLFLTFAILYFNFAAGEVSADIVNTDFVSSQGDYDV